MKCDPEAEKYKLKFKKNKDTLVSVLFKLFNEEVFDSMVIKFKICIYYIKSLFVFFFLLIFNYSNSIFEK